MLAVVFHKHVSDSIIDLGRASYTLDSCHRVSCQATGIRRYYPVHVKFPIFNFLLLIFPVYNSVS